MDLGVLRLATDECDTDGDIGVFLGGSPLDGHGSTGDQLLTRLGPINRVEIGVLGERRAHIGQKGSGDGEAHRDGGR